MYYYEDAFQSSEGFIKKQAEDWDPILSWFNTKFDVQLEASTGLCPCEISRESSDKLEKYFSVYNKWAMSGRNYFGYFNSIKKDYMYKTNIKFKVYFLEWKL